MQYFIAVVPPDILTKKILRFQKQWKENYFPSLVEPHITVKAQGGLSEDLMWLEKVQDVARTTSPFTINLTTPDTFGSSVVFINIESPELSSLHNALILTVNPSPEQLEKYFEREGEFHSHLTLGTTSSGLSVGQIDEVKDAARTELSNLGSFTVSFLRVYKQEQADQPYIPFKDLKLVGKVLDKK